MFFEQIQAAALSSESHKDNPNYVQVFVSSLAENTEVALAADKLRAAIKDSNLEAMVFVTGSYGYYDLEPILRIEIPGQPAVLYSNVTAETTVEIIREYLIKSNTRPELAFCRFGEPKIEGIRNSAELELFKMQKRVSLRNCGCIDPEDINDYILRAEGYSGLSHALNLSPGEVIRELKLSGLVDEEGVSVGERWAACQEASGQLKYVICRALDTKPQSMTSRLLLESDPHSALEGMLIAAYAVGASQCIIGLDNQDKSAKRRIEGAINQIKERGISGKNIPGTDFNVDIHVQEIAPSIVLEDDTALLNCLEGLQAMPCINNSLPFGGRFKGQPALILNIETFSAVSAVFKNGLKESTAEDKKTVQNTHVITLGGTVGHKYTVEVPSGSSVPDIIKYIGGGVPEGKTIRAVRCGGPAGTYMEMDSEVRIGNGSGTLEVIPRGVCPIEMVYESITFIHEQSCGKCVFCREGTYQMARTLEEIIQNGGNAGGIDLLAELGEQMKLGSLCFLGKRVADSVLSSIKIFKSDYETHAREKRCSEI